MRTQVGIIGAGPAGLMLSHLLHLAGIESVVLERHSREYVEARIRAGVIEHWAADLLVETGVGERMQREGLVHGGIYFSFNDELRHIDFEALVGKGILVYGQHEVVKDLIARRLADGGQILFDVDDVSVEGLTGAPKIRFRHGGREQELDCDFIGGCDGFHGVCRPSIPGGVLTDYERDYPFGWLGILAQAKPVSERADLLLPSARLCAVQHARAGAGAALHPVRAGRGPRALAGRAYLGRAACASRCRQGRGARRGAGFGKGASPRCAASWSSRCNMAGCSSPATPPISCRRPAPRG